MSPLWDVLVVGAGPAGSALAIRLAKAGLSVCMVDSGDIARARPGECLSPETVPALAALGHGDLLDDPACAQRCYGVQSLWMSREVEFRDYFAERSMRGFFLERQVFDGRLRERARQHGVSLELGVRVTDVRFGSPVRIGGLRGDETWTASARFVVDGSGKAASIARPGGAFRQRLSRQLAVAASFPAGDKPPASSGWLLIEADSQGWWSAATTSSGQRHLVRFFPGGEKEGHRAADLACQLARTRLVRNYASAAELLTTRLQVFDAGCSTLSHVASEHWLAVGEAALAFDPVSSQGLAHAFGATESAALAIIKRVREGSNDGLVQYQQQTRITLQHTLQGLARHYAQCLALSESQRF